MNAGCRYELMATVYNFRDIRGGIVQVVEPQCVAVNLCYDGNDVAKAAV